MSGDNTVQSPSILTPVSSPPVQDALRRLMALPAWYEQFCPGPHPYANPDGKKQDSAEIMAAVSADIRAVCGELIKRSQEPGVRSQEEDDEGYKQTWETLWREICTNPDGSLNLDSIQRELHDFSLLARHASAVYCHVTGGLLSKTNYYPQSVISAADAEVQRLLDEREQEVRKELAELREVINDLYPFAVTWVQHWTNSPSYGCGIPAKIHTQIIERAKKHVMLMEDSREGAKTQREGEK